MQRYTASIFPSSSGSADNFHVCVGLGRMTVDGRVDEVKQEATHKEVSKVREDKAR